MKKRLSIFLLFLLVMTGGCNGKEQMPEEIVFCSPLVLCKDGILYCCGDLLYITDYITGATVPLCNKPNCAHEPRSSTNENPQCNAAYPGFISSAFLYQDKLYVFVSEGLNHTSVYMAESTGEGRRKIAETDYTVYIISEFQDGKAYFHAWFAHYQEDYSLRQEREEFIALFDTAEQRFEYLTTPDVSLSIRLCGITGEEIFFQQYSILEAEKVSNWRDVPMEYIAKNLETGEERYFSDGTVERIGDFCVVESGFYYWLEKDGICELWKKETAGDEILICSADYPSNMRPIINGEPVLDKSDFQKELITVGTCGDMILVMDGRKGGRQGIITIDNYLGDIDEIVYPEFPNVTYID